MWWKANLFYFILGSLVYDLYCPLRFVKQLPTTEDTTGMLYWMGLVALRNLSIVVSELEPPVSSCFPRLLIAFLCHIAVWYGGWHHQLYTLKKLPVKEKFLAEPSYTHGYLLDRDILLSCLGSLVASGVECLVVLHWEARQASGSNALHGSPWGELLSDPLAVVFGIAVCSWWSDVHFWLAHRSMHAWLPKAWSHIDPGAALYRHVHSVHHKSFNPGPWSGLAMHPLEHLAYFTRGIICLWPALGLHPAFFYFVNTRAMIGPAVGHSGFGAAGGSHFHYLHHGACVERDMPACS